MDISQSPFSKAVNSTPAVITAHNSNDSNNSNENIDLGYYVRLLLHNKWKIMAFMFVVTAIVVTTF